MCVVWYRYNLNAIGSHRAALCMIVAIFWLFSDYYVNDVKFTATIWRTAYVKWPIETVANEASMYTYLWSIHQLNDEYYYFFIFYSQWIGVWNSHPDDNNRPCNIPTNKKYIYLKYCQVTLQITIKSQKDFKCKRHKYTENKGIFLLMFVIIKNCI